MRRKYIKFFYLVPCRGLHDYILKKKEGTKMEERGISKQELKWLSEVRKQKEFTYRNVLSSMCAYPHETVTYAHKFLPRDKCTEKKR
jgi:hypothetical protein